MVVCSESRKAFLESFACPGKFKRIPENATALAPEGVYLLFLPAYGIIQSTRYLSISIYTGATRFV
jgi:hypothetical protein